ncbi:MOSC domain-containing protein [Paenibacillaceae bacterium WGS1546]|uniref:MOSC domain-containing protein n=1 Tax=Cohnella sp. WGS1546 TaxID=3366810 RepID=UPI00372D7E85
MAYEHDDAGFPLLSLNIGKVRSDVYKGKEARSGIRKTGVDRALRLTELGLAGDEQADLVNHGGPDKAVCVYSLDHYPHWEDVLKRALPNGAFGENFSVRGMLEDEVRIGDVFRVGTATVQISQPRQPCWKLAMRWGLNELPLLVTESGATGFYFRVLLAGQVKAGDVLRLERPHAAGITVAEANRVMHRDKGDAAGIRRLLALGELAANWRETFAKRLARLENGD